MPKSKFLEEFPLLKKFDYQVPPTLNEIPIPTIHMNCKICKSGQTFFMSNKYSEGFEYANFSSKGATVTARYICVGCGRYKRTFLLKFGIGLNYVMKVGQEPPWEISIDKKLEKTLGEHVDYYKKGLTCESQGYGVGAYAYYRRITEEIIDQLLDSILDLMDEKEKGKYKEALQQTKETKVTEKKIELVKDLLPTSLRPGGMNPLGVLHDVLSEGLHGKGDEECLEIATSIRETLQYLINQIIESKEASRQFTESMKKILDRKKRKE